MPLLAPSSPVGPQLAGRSTSPLWASWPGPSSPFWGLVLMNLALDLMGEKASLFLRAFQNTVEKEFCCGFWNRAGRGRPVESNV